MKITLLSTFKNYQKKYLFKDIFAGIIIAAMSIPISMGYAEIAGLPAVYGLYGSVIPLIIFAIFSTSRQLIFGVDAAPAAIIGSAIASMGVVAGSPEAMKIVPVIAFLSGIWLLLFWIIKAGRIVGYISTPVMGGFISGISVTIIMMQIPKLMGSKASHGEVIELVEAIIEAAKDINWISLMLGIVTLVIILIAKKISPKFPMTIIVMIAGAMASYYLKLESYGIKMLSAVEPGLLPPKFPEILSIDISLVLGTSLTVAAVVMSETLLAETNFATKNNYKIEDNQEILTFGLANIAASLFGCCSVNGSVSRTAMGEQYGGKTQLMSVVASVILIALLLFGTGFIGYLPVPVLTAIIITALMSVVEVHLAVRLFKVSKSEFWIFMAAFAGVLVLGTIYGVVIGLVLSFTDTVLRAAKPSTDFLGVIPGHGNYYSLERNSNARPIEHVIIYRFSANLFFGNEDVLLNDIENAIKEDTHCVIIDARSISSIDITAADALESLYKKLKDRKIKFYMTEHIADVNDQLRKLGFGYLIEDGFVRKSITRALEDAGFYKPYVLEERFNENMAPEIDDDKSRDEKAIAEFEWAFGEFAESQFEKDVKEIINYFDMNQEAYEKITDEDIDSILKKSHIWNNLGYVDEDEILNRLELHVKEIAEKIKDNEIHIVELLENRRRRLAKKLEQSNPRAAQKLYEHQKAIEEKIKKDNPEAYAHLEKIRQRCKRG